MPSPFLEASKRSSARSPFETKVKSKSALENPLLKSPVFAPDVVGEVKKLPTMSTDQIQTTGAAAGQAVKNITMQVLNHQRANSDDAMSERLGMLIRHAKELDPSSVKESKGITKLFKRVLGIKETLFEQFDTASGRVDILSKELQDDVKKEKDSLVFSENLRSQLNEYGKALSRDIELLQKNYEVESEEFEQIAEEDLEHKQAARDLMDLLEIRIGDLSALRLQLPSLIANCVRMEKASKQLIRAANNILNDVIPVYTANFVIYLGSVRQAKTAQVLNNVLDEFNDALLLGGQMAAESQIQAARLSNRQLLSLETMQENQKNALQLLEELNSINNEARAARVAYIEGVHQLENEVVDAIRKGTNNK